MPLIKGIKAKTKAGRSFNIKTEVLAGKPLKQAIAISYSVQNQKKKKR